MKTHLLHLLIMILPSPVEHEMCEGGWTCSFQLMLWSIISKHTTCPPSQNVIVMILFCNMVLQSQHAAKCPEISFMILRFIQTPTLKETPDSICT